MREGRRLSRHNQPDCVSRLKLHLSVSVCAGERSLERHDIRGFVKLTGRLLENKTFSFGSG